MINSIGSNQDYWSARVRNMFMQSSNSIKFGTSNTAEDDSNAVDSIDSSLLRTSTESYSINDHMEMMQGSRPMGPPPTEETSFSDVDADGDGSLSTDEYENLQSLINNGETVSTEDFFAKYDQNSDGEITSDEILNTESEVGSMQPMGPPPPPPSDSTSFSDIDADSDGSLSTDEYETLLSQINDENAVSAEEFFSAYDVDGDGEITSDELFGSSTSETDSMQPMGPPPPPPSDSISFSDIDADSDGSLSTDEYETLLSQINDENAVSAEEFFSAYDVDGDGEITSDELFGSSTSETDSMQPMGPPPPPPAEMNSSTETEDSEDDSDISNYLQNDMTRLMMNAISTYQINNNILNYQDESSINSLT